MREENISKMNIKELREEVQLLRDELAVFKRKYEDTIYNLDENNFSKSFTVTQNDAKAQFKITADAITSLVQKQANLKDAIEITDLSQAVDTSAVYKILTYNTSDGADNVVIGENYYYYNSLTKAWEKISGDTVYTMFKQTDEGFVLKGNTIIDGSTTITRNLKLSGNVTWDMENSPVLTRYSSDNVCWHSIMVDGDMYMQMSFDGGSHWSTSTKVVGTDGVDGRDGINGSDAEITPESVFNALTDNGDTQGIFAAFVNNNNCLYINAEYLATKVANVADELYIGDFNTWNEQKAIYFNDIASIHTYATGVGQYGLSVESNGFRINSLPDQIEILDPEYNGEVGAPTRISLADYVKYYAGSGTTVAVFG